MLMVSLFKRCFTAGLEYEIPRDHIEVLATLGEGQFGDVHKGAFM